MTFLEWLILQQERDDVIGIYSRAVLDDFSKGNLCHLVDSACESSFRNTGIETFERYCKHSGLPLETVNLLMLGNAMSALEYNVKLLSSEIQGHSPLNLEQEKSVKAKIVTICEFIPGVLQDMDSEMRSREI